MTERFAGGGRLGQFGVHNTYAHAVNAFGDVVGSAQGVSAPSTAVGLLGALGVSEGVVALESSRPRKPGNSS